MGVSGQRHVAAALLPPQYVLDREARRASELVWTQRQEEKPFASAGDLTPVVQSVVRHYTDWATPAPLQGALTYFN
jgi:hypothetical protein